MIESVMYFGIGFLVAALLGLLFVPLVHNRAVRLTMRTGTAPPALAINLNRLRLWRQYPRRATPRSVIDVRQGNVRQGNVRQSTGTEAIGRFGFRPGPDQNGFQVGCEVNLR